MAHVSEPGEWTPLHDLALIYLTLTHGADADLDQVEVDAMATKLRGWQPAADAGAIRRVMEEVMLVYMSASGDDMLATAIASIRESMPRGKRISVLNDLADIASADGMIVGGEVSFIQELARRWEVDGDLAD